MDDDNQLLRTNEKKLLMTNKNKKIVCCMHFNGLLTAASTEYLFFTTCHAFLLFSKTQQNTLAPG